MGGNIDSTNVKTIIAIPTLPIALVKTYGGLVKALRHAFRA